MNGIDTDKINPHIEDCIARQEPIMKVTFEPCLLNDILIEKEVA